MKINSGLAALKFSFALAVLAVASVSFADPCLNLTGTYQRVEGDTLFQRIIKQEGCTKIILTKRMVTQIWSQQKQAMIPSVFEMSDYDQTPGISLSTLETEINVHGFIVKSLQEKMSSDLKTVIPVYNTREFTLDANGDLVETWRLLDRRPGPNFNQDLGQTSVLPVLKRVR